MIWWNGSGRLSDNTGHENGKKIRLNVSYPKDLRAVLYIFMYSTFPLIWKAFHIKGKIERLFKTLQMQLLPLLPESCGLQELNGLLGQWVETDYHQRVHSSTGQAPLERYLGQVQLLRSAPKDLRDHFRILVRRQVNKYRSISLNGRLYEAPVGLIGQTVSLLYHPEDSSRIEVFLEGGSWGFLSLLNPQVNSRVRRVSGQETELVDEAKPAAGSNPTPAYRDGQLFRESL
jgi:putative transposase